MTLTSTSSLLSSLFALPTTSGPAGPHFTLPAPTTILPREKPLPKPKPLTKWERFAKEKGISHKRTERDEWDDEKQEWVRRWGRGGKNRQAEDQWLHEVKAKPGERSLLDEQRTRADMLRQIPITILLLLPRPSEKPE